jgi:hypothetical protein
VTFRASDHVYDPDCPQDSVSFSLDECSPPNATIDSVSGVLNWMPSAEQAMRTNTLCIRITDDSPSRLSNVLLVQAGPFTEPSHPRFQGVSVDGEWLWMSLDTAQPDGGLVIESAAELRSAPNPIPTEWVNASDVVWEGQNVRVRRTAARQFFRIRVQ